jgi:hypothetical protein
MVDIARVRRESLRWSLLVALNKTRPYTASETLLLDVSRAIYPDTTPLELRRELDYLADRKMVDLEKTLRRLVCRPDPPRRRPGGIHRGMRPRHRPPGKVLE